MADPGGLDLPASFSLWQEPLAQVFDLILFNIDRIVDDTTLEKLLEILQFIYNTQEGTLVITNCASLSFFLRLPDVQVCSSNTISFALRLSGVICSGCEGFRVLSDGNSLDYLFQEVLQKDGLWADASVRNSYFNAVIAMLKNIDGFLWIKNSDVLQQAMNSLVDSSIFVADSARKFIAKYLISLYHSSMDRKYDTMANKLEGHDCSKTTMNVFTADLNVCFQCIIDYLKALIEGSPTGLFGTMKCQVSVSQLLLSIMEEDSKTAQEILRPSAIMLSCLKLLHYVNKDECMSLIDVISTMFTNTSVWQINWMLLLHLKDNAEVLRAVVEFILVLYKRVFVLQALQITQGLIYAGGFLEFDGPSFCLLYKLIMFPVHAMLHKIAAEENNLAKFSAKDATKQLLSTDGFLNNGYKVVSLVLNDTLDGLLSTPSVTQSLAITTETVGNKTLLGFPTLVEVVQNWCKDILEFLGQQPENYFRRNRLTRLCLKAIIVCVDGNLFDDQDETMLDGKKQSFCLFIKLLSVSQDNMTISTCFEGLKALLSKTDVMVLCKYVNEGNGYMPLKQLLCLHCSNSCWDVRDSSLSFIQDLLVILDTTYIEQILDQNLLLLLWQLIKDPESYVRASAIGLLGVLSSNNTIWKLYCEAISLSEEELLKCVLNAFQNEEAAFARRAMVDILIFWLQQGNNTMLMHTDSDETCYLSTPISEALEKGRQDFDWEVKLRVLKFWETLLYDHCKNNGKILHLRSIETSCLRGISTAILGALTDCDKPVRREGLVLLELLKTFVHLDDLPTGNDLLEYSGSFDNLKNFIKFAKRENHSLLQVLFMINLSESAANVEETSILSDLLSFLKDILAATSKNKENLLDCY